MPCSEETLVCLLSIMDMMLYQLHSGDQMALAMMASASHSEKIGVSEEVWKQTASAVIKRWNQQRSRNLFAW